MKVFTNPVKLCRSSQLRSLITYTEGDREMRKVTEYLSWGDEEESSEGLLDAESDGICSLSSTQVIALSFPPISAINCCWVFLLDFTHFLLVFFFLCIENLRLCRLLGFWSDPHVFGESKDAFSVYCM